MRLSSTNNARNVRREAIAPGIVDRHTSENGDDAHGAGDPKARRAVSGANTAATIGPAKVAAPHPTIASGTTTHT